MALKDLPRILQSQGFGSRKDCTRIVRKLGVEINGEITKDHKTKFETDGLEFSVNGKRWVFRQKVYILMHKPNGMECSRKPKIHPSVLGLLPSQLIERDIQPIGRLDVDTTGLLLLTDDGQFNHNITSPKKDLPKIYEVTAKHPLSESNLSKLIEGVILEDEETPVFAKAVEKKSEKVFLMTITEGKYHQVKRMLAAAGNRVELLHRVSIGPYNCEELEAGEWRFLEGDEIESFI
jgi:16S rRNA pseudouridine516 synthase